MKWTKAQTLDDGGEVFASARYTVIRRYIGLGEMGRGWHLSIRRNDRGLIRDWRELQEIKNDLVDPEAEGVELYPAESRLVDTSNQFHLWVFEPPYRFPFGYADRLVLDDPGVPNAKQRARVKEQP